MRTIKSYRCHRCQHTWKPRKSGIPGQCPRCRTIYWRIAPPEYGQ